MCPSNHRPNSELREIANAFEHYESSWTTAILVTTERHLKMTLLTRRPFMTQNSVVFLSQSVLWLICLFARRIIVGKKELLCAAVLAVVLGGTGCSTSVNANAGTSGCTTDSTVSCYSGGTGYQCTGSSEPSTSDVCYPNGTGEWCCYASSSCATDSSITCTTDAYGYSCTQGDPAPDVTDTSIICSIPTTANGMDDYCCASSTASAGSTCNLDQSITTCQTDSYGFSCTGSDRPDSDYSGITCSAGTAGASSTLYCCVYDGTSTTVTCSSAYQEPAASTLVCGTDCDACLQSYECNAEYKACDSACQDDIQSMESCMKDAAAAAGGTLPSDSAAETTCSTTYLGGSNSAAYALWWSVINNSLNCSIQCCAAF